MPATAIEQQLHIQMRCAPGFVVGRNGEQMWPSLWNQCCWFPPCHFLALHCLQEAEQERAHADDKDHHPDKEVQGLCERWLCSYPWELGALTAQHTQHLMFWRVCKLNWMAFLQSRPYTNKCVPLNPWLSFPINWLYRLKVELNKCFIPLWLTPLWYLHFQMSMFSKASYLPLISLFQAFQKRSFESVWNVDTVG